MSNTKSPFLALIALNTRKSVLALTDTFFTSASIFAKANFISTSWRIFDNQPNLISPQINKITDKSVFCRGFERMNLSNFLFLMKISNFPAEYLSREWQNFKKSEKKIKFRRHPTSVGLSSITALFQAPNKKVRSEFRCLYIGLSYDLQKSQKKS